MNKMRENLVRLQALQLRAYDAGLNMEVHARGTGEPNNKQWVIGHVKLEGASFNEDDGCHCFCFYEFSKAKTHRKEFEKLEEFISKYEKKAKL